MSKADKVTLKDWKLPPLMPRVVDDLTTVGIPLPDFPTLEDLEIAWFEYDPLNWELDELNRREWFTDFFAPNFEHWKLWMPYDSTHVLKDTIKTKRAKGGILVGIKGPKGSGKSRLAQMIIERIISSGIRPHVLFQYKDIEIQVKAIDEEQEIGLLIDEDLKATGHHSANLVVHIHNSWDTSRKAIQSGVCTGVNLSFEAWGDTLDLRLEPCGFNVHFLATRFVMFSKKLKFLGFGALQYKHLPEDLVNYYEEVGTWHEYDDRASAFSRSVTRAGGAVDAIDEDTFKQHVTQLVLLLNEEYVDSNRDLPPDIACRRLARKAKVPSKSVGYVNEVIWWAKDAIAELEENKPGLGFVPRASKGWDGLRADLVVWMTRQRIRTRTAKILGDWFVSCGLNQSEIGAKYGISRDAVNKSVGRYADVFEGKQSELGKIAESWLAAHTDSFAPKIGTGHKESIDLTLENRGTEYAVNVKWALRESEYRRQFDSTPEDTMMPNAYLVIVVSKVPMLKIHKITGSQTYAHHAKPWGKTGGGVPCAPEEFADTFKELIE